MYSRGECGRGLKIPGCAPRQQTELRTNIDGVHKKSMSRLCFQRRLRSFCACSKMLKILSQSVVASTLFFADVCWGRTICIGNFKCLNKQIQKVGSVTGVTIWRTLYITSWMAFSCRLIPLHCHRVASGNPSYNIYKYTL